MSFQKKLRKVGAVALTFCLILTFLFALPISAARTETPLPLCPYLDGDHYYTFGWYYENGILTPDTLLHVVTPDSECWVQQDEYSYYEGDVYDPDIDDYVYVEKYEWMGFGSFQVAPFDVYCTVSELYDIFECYRIDGDNYLDFTDSWILSDIYPLTDIQIYVVTDIPEDTIPENPHITLFLDTFKGMGNGLKNAFNGFVFTPDGGISNECKVGLTYLGIGVGFSVSAILITMIFKKRR